MSKVKKEPGYAGLILIYGLILILRMLHIASLDKLFNNCLLYTSPSPRDA